MKHLKIFLSGCLLAITTLGIYSCSKSDSSPVLAQAGTYAMVNIHSTGFQPATLTSLQGSKILWTNMDATTHTVTSDDGTSFNSGYILPGGSYTFTADQLGSYPYHCSIHPAEKGTLQIVIK
jgi:plastocyanin